MGFTLGWAFTMGWKCLAELIENAFDDFNEIMIFIILEAAARRCRFALCVNIASAPSLMPSPLL
ncbi:hypothetical protein [Streptomyces sp. NPDC055134]